MSSTNLEETIRQILAKRFTETAIERVIVKSNSDDDGDQVLRVIVVLGAGAASLNRRSLVGAVRHLRSEMEDRKDFPVLSFVTKREASQLKLEAA